MVVCASWFWGFNHQVAERPATECSSPPSTSNRMRTAINSRSLRLLISDPYGATVDAALATKEPPVL